MDMFLIFSQTQNSPKSSQMPHRTSCGIMVDNAQRSTLTEVLSKKCCKKRVLENVSRFCVFSRIREIFQKFKK